MANAILQTGVGTVFGIDVIKPWIKFSGSWVELPTHLSGSQELTIESDMVEVRDPNTAAVDGLVFFNQRRTMSIEFTCAGATKTAAKDFAIHADIVPGAQFKMQVTADTLVGSTSAEGSISSSSFWSVTRASRTRTVGEIAVWRLDLVRYGDNASTATPDISEPAS